jgi:hypothetical protein
MSCLAVGAGQLDYLDGCIYLREYPIYEGNAHRSPSDCETRWKLLRCLFRTPATLAAGRSTSSSPIEDRLCLKVKVHTRSSREDDARYVYQGSYRSPQA